MIDRLIQIVLIVYASIMTMLYFEKREEVNEYKARLEEILKPIIPQPDTARIYETEHVKEKIIRVTKKDTVYIFKRDTLFFFTQDTVLENQYLFLNSFRFYERIERKRDSIITSLNFELVRKPKIIVDILDRGDKIRFRGFVAPPQLADFIDLEYRYAIEKPYWLYLGVGISYPLSPALNLTMQYKFKHLFSLSFGFKSATLTYSRFIN